MGPWVLSDVLHHKQERKRCGAWHARSGGEVQRGAERCTRRSARWPSSLEVQAAYRLNEFNEFGSFQRDVWMCGGQAARTYTRNTAQPKWAYGADKVKREDVLTVDAGGASQNGPGGKA